MATSNQSQITDGFVKAVQQGAPLRVQAIQAMSKAAQDQAAALKIEQSRVVNLYGANSHQAVLLEERIVEHSILISAIAAELQTSQVRVPQTSADEFVVYGRVLDSSGRPLKDMEVSATDPRGTILVNAVSDPNGRYELHVAAATPAVPAAAADALKAAQPTTFQLVVSDKSRTTIVRPAETLKSSAGFLAYREITVPAAAK